jgi:hypothetical protein
LKFNATPASEARLSASLQFLVHISAIQPKGFHIFTVWNLRRKKMGMRNELFFGIYDLGFRMCEFRILFWVRK